jgi:hypothetical protein
MGTEKQNRKAYRNIFTLCKILLTEIYEFMGAAEHERDEHALNTTCDHTNEPERDLASHPGVGVSHSMLSNSGSVKTHGIH